MREMRYFFFAAVIAMLAGCATTAGSQVPQAETVSDGGFTQREEFKDLPQEMQESILYGGGGE